MPKGASTSICSRASAWRRSDTRIAALARAIAEQAQTLIHTSNLFYHPLQGQLAERLANLSGSAARVLLQQRHGSGGSVPEVRAPLLVHARASRAPSSSRSRNRFTAARSARCRSRPTSTTARRSSRCCRQSSSCHATTPAALAAAVSTIDRGDHRRAGPGRRRHPPADAGVRRGDQRGVRARPARCSSPTKYRAASAGPATRSTSRRSA